MDRMFCYIWHEKSVPNECKFGERWVFEGEDPEVEVRQRIKDSVGVRKDLINTGEIELVWFGDVHEYALKKCPDRAKKQGRVDDHIRLQIGHRKGTTGEVHQLSADEMQIRVVKILQKAGQPLKYVGLTPWQFNAAENTLAVLNEGKRTIIAELCPRFGKTIWAGALAVETNVNVLVIVSYVLTSFTSFIKDLSSFQQFANMEHVDLSDDNYQEKINNALANGKQVVTYLSLCKGSKRQERVDFVFGLNKTRLVVVDEADYGAHRDQQFKLLKAARKADDILVLMTGTNADRAVAGWQPDHYLSVTYPELLIEKKQAA